MKNIDKIRQMSVEELADLLSNSNCRGCVAKDLCNQYLATGKGGKLCRDVFIEWLDQEVKESMPKLRGGDILRYKFGYSDNVHTATVIAEGWIYSSDSEYLTEITDNHYRIIEVRRFNGEKLETIWRC